MNRQTPAQLYRTLAGALLVIAGIVGFFYSSGFDTGASGVAGDTTRSSGSSPSTAGATSSASSWGLLGLALANSGRALLRARLRPLRPGDRDLGLRRRRRRHPRTVRGQRRRQLPRPALGLTGLAAGAASPPLRRRKPSADAERLADRPERRRTRAQQVGRRKPATGEQPSSRIQRPAVSRTPPGRRRRASRPRPARRRRGANPDRGHGTTQLRGSRSD